MQATRAGAAGAICAPPLSSPAAPAAAPLGQLDVNEEPFVPPPQQQQPVTSALLASNHCWTIGKLEIPNIRGKNAIDLMSHKDYDLILPPEVYEPPSWEGRKPLVKAIIEAAMQQGRTSLLTQLTADRKGRRIIVGCNMGRAYRAESFLTSTNHNKENKNHSFSCAPIPATRQLVDTANNTSSGGGSGSIMIDIANVLPQYKEGVRLDRIVNKNAAIMGTSYNRQWKKACKEILHP